MADFVKDITLDDNDLMIINGDFDVSYSDQQHIELLMITYLGGWKEFPLVGVGLTNYINSSGSELIIRRNMIVQLESDSYQVNQISILPGPMFDIDAIRLQSI